MRRTLDLSTRRKELLEKLKQQQGIIPAASVPLLKPVPREARQLFPLSFAQQRLWLLDQLEPGTPIYNIPLALRLSGNINVEALKYALCAVIRRHEALRTAIVAVEGVPLQKIMPADALLIPLTDLRAMDQKKRQQEALRLVAEEAVQPFDLSQGPLIRAALFQLAADEYILTITMHHIAADAWSVEVLYQEIIAHYSAFEQGRPSPLPPLPVQYIDYALWQRQWLQGEMLERQLGYWKEQLANLPTLLQLPTDRPRPTIQTFHGASVSFSLSSLLTARLKALSQREGVTLFMMLLAAFQVWLYRHTAQEDITVGTPVANRLQADLEPLIGFFINTLVLRTDLSGNPSFRDVLRRVRDVTLNGFNCREVPFELIVETLQPERNLSYSPLFQVLFTLQNVSASSTQIPSIPAPDFICEPLEGENTVAKFDLTLAMSEEEMEGESILKGEFEYNSDLFDAATIDRFTRRFIALLEAIVEQPDLRMRELTCLPPAEREQLLITWNATQRPYGQVQCIHQLFAEQATLTPDAIALVFEDEQISYDVLNHRANQLANYLVKRGVAPEVRVGICIERSIDMVIGLLGILKAGGAYVPLDPAYPTERITFTLQDAGISLLLTHQSLLPRLHQIAVESICLDSLWQELTLESATDPDSAVRAENLAYVIYTSGSTGKPKGVMIPHRALYNHMRWMQADLPLTGSDRVLQKTPFSFDASIWEFYAPLLAGAQLVIARQGGHQDSDYLIAACIEYGITILQLVPSVLRLLLEQGAGMSRCHSLRSVFCGGEELTADLQRAFHAQLDGDLYNLYGPSETTVQVAYWHCRANDGLRVPIGRPIANTYIYLLDAHQQVVPVGVAGEIYIGGENLGRGYLDQAALTAERFVPDPYSSKPGARLYRTGDLGRVQADGSLEYLGRIDHQVKIRGHRIETGEIESVLIQHPVVQDAVVIVHEDRPGNKYLVAYIVTNQDGAALSQELRQFLRARLPDYMLPAVYMPLPHLPLTHHGKLDRQALPIPQAKTTRQQIQFPRNPQEEAMADIWKEVLGLQMLDIRENFFEIGGHSLLAMQVISRIRAVFQLELPLRSLFEAPTVEELTSMIVLARNGDQQPLEPPITRAPRKLARQHTAPISFAQQRLWILDRIDPGKATYNMPLALRLSGPLNVAALERSLCEIVTRHAVLRTTFPIMNDTPIQSIMPAPVTMILPFIDLRHLPADERWQALLAVVAEEAEKPFNLVTGPLLRIHLLVSVSSSGSDSHRLPPLPLKGSITSNPKMSSGNAPGVDETEHVLLLTMHHIVSDGWSMDVLNRELAILYLAFSAGKPSPLPPLSIQYADYAIWQRQWLQGDVLERQLNYWRKQLAGAPSLLALPTDQPRSAIRSSRGASYSFVILPAQVAALQKLGQHAGATLFMTLLAAFQVFLCRYCNQDDIVVGTPIANRTHKEVEDLIGFFVNTLVLRTDLSRNPSFLEVIERVRHVVLDAITYQDIPFEQIVEALQPERDLGRSPLFQVMFVLQNASQEQLDISPLVASPLEVEHNIAKFDLTLALTQSDHGLEGAFEYNTDLFEHDTIARMAEHFQILLTAIVNSPAQTIQRLPLLPQEQYRQIVIDWNATGRNYAQEQLIYALVEEQAALHPAVPAISARGKEMSYGELNRRANQLAHHLQTQGVRPGCYVGIYLPRTLEMIVALLATLKAGAAYLPLDASTPPARVAFMLGETQTALLITQKTMAARLTTCETPLLCLDKEEERLKTQPVENLAVRITPEYPAYIIYTSGSTGNPKGVIINHKALLNMVSWYQETFRVTEQDKTTHLANLGFDAAVFEIWPYLSRGALLYLVEEEVRLSPTALVPWLVKRGITISFLPTSLVEMVVNRPWPAQTALRFLLTGGDQLHRAPAKDLPFTLINMYGPTENTVVTTWAPIAAEQEELPVSGEKRLPVIGRAIANAQLYVLNRAGEPQPLGVPGELYIGGQSLSQGYLHRPDLTATCFVPDPFGPQPGARLYRTGDIVRYLADGNLEFLGRRDHQVKIRGFRIELGEIETALMSYAGVREAVVVVSESLPGEKRLAAYVVPQEKVSLSKEGLQRSLKERLPDYMVPVSIAFIEELPLTPHGKIDRQALALRRPITTTTQEKHIAARDAIELQLVHLWERLLGVSPIGVTDNFFQLGGHSLTGVRLMSQIQRLFGVDLPLSTLFEGATIASLAAVLRQQEAAITQTPLVEIQPEGSNPPFFCVHPSGGEVLCYMNLARHLGADQPVCGLRALDPDAHTSLEEMARAYIEALRTVQQHGPYFLGGWSMGGVIAFEMARQLEERGEHIAFLGLFDSHLPPHQIDDEHTLLTKFVSDLAGMSDVAFSFGEDEPSAADSEAQLQHFLLDAQRANILPPGVDASYIKRQFLIFKQNLKALCAYQPRPYGGHITLYQASAFTDGKPVEITYGWHQFAKQVHNHAVPGNHYTMMRDPQVEILARQVRASIKGEK